MAVHFKSVMNANYKLVVPPPTRQTAIGRCSKVASYEMQGEQLHHSNPVKHGESLLKFKAALYLELSFSVALGQSRQRFA